MNKFFTLIHVLQCMVSCIVICTESAKKSIVPALIFYAGLYILVLQFFWPECQIWEKNWRQKPAKRRNIKKFFMTSSWLWFKIIEQAIHFKLKKRKKRLHNYFKFTKTASIFAQHLSKTYISPTFQHHFLCWHVTVIKNSFYFPGMRGGRGRGGRGRGTRGGRGRGRGRR